jgi:hypothetical protein
MFLQFYSFIFAALQDGTDVRIAEAGEGLRGHWMRWYVLEEPVMMVRLFICVLLVPYPMTHRWCRTYLASVDIDDAQP